MMFKKFFNSDKNNHSKMDNLKTAYSEMSHDFAPVFNRSTSKFMEVITKNPKRTFIWMMIIVISNFAVLCFFTNAFKSNEKEIGFSQIVSKMYNGSFGRKDLKGTYNEMPDIQFSFANYEKAEQLKDSLQYLMDKKTMSYSDTVLFVKIMDEFNELTQGKDKSIPKISIEDLRKIGQRDTIRHK